MADHDEYEHKFNTIVHKNGYREEMAIGSTDLSEGLDEILTHLLNRIVKLSDKLESIEEKLESIQRHGVPISGVACRGD